MMLWEHMIAFSIGFVLDLVIGDPHRLPHPVRLIGRLIGGLESAWNKAQLGDAVRLRRGIGMVVVVLAVTVAVAAGILSGAYLLHPWAGIMVEAVMTGQLLAGKDLRVESMKVCEKLKQNDLEGARKAVSMIVGRDTARLDEAGITRAAIETVAENTSDGEIAPMLALAFGGPVLGFFYKAVNTMDSMVGYKNERYLFFGRAAARLDDVVNFLPARLCALGMIAVSGILEVVSGSGIYSARGAVRIYRRDRGKHASPNSAHTEAVCAGAMGIRLGGDASYFGRTVHKPWIGDEIRPVEAEDIRRANLLLYGTAFLWFALCMGSLAGIGYLTGWLCH